MRKVFLIFILFSSPVLAEWQTWQPWLTEIGVSPFVDVYYAFSVPDTNSIEDYEIERTGVDFIGGVQANIPPFYLRWGFSNLIGVFTNKGDSTFSPLFANWRTGLQFPYEATIYDLSALFIMNITGDCKFTGIVGEVAYFRNIAGIDIFGTVRGGLENIKVPDAEARSETILGASLGLEWHQDFITPYIGASITYPMEAEIRWLVSGGIQLALPYTYVAGLPSIAYPRIFRGPPIPK